jgi:predicted permease
MTPVRAIGDSLRLLSRRPRASVLVLTSLALGSGATIALFALVYGVFLKPLPFPHGDRLVWISEVSDDIPQRALSYPNFRDWQTRSAAFESLAVVGGGGMTLTETDGVRRAVNGRQVSADYFRTLGVAPHLGRDFTAAEDVFGAPSVALISDALWRDAFGRRRSIVGTTTTLNERNVTIVGVLDRTARMPGDPDVWTLTGQQAVPGGPLLDRANRMAGYVVARLKPGTTIAQATADLRRVSEGLAAEHPIANAGSRPELVPFRETLTGNVRTPLLLCFGAVVALLGIVATNIANLLLIRAVGRTVEFALRSALGAQSRHLLQQVFTESVILAALGTGLGFILADWGLATATRFMPPNLLASGGAPVLDGPVIAFASALAMLLGVAIGAPAAWRYAAAPQRRNLAAPTATQHRGERRIRGASIVVQTALAVALSIAAGLLTVSLAAIARSDPGFDKNGVLTFDVLIGEPSLSRDALTQQYARLVATLEAVPGVAAATVANELAGFTPTWQTDIVTELGDQVGVYRKVAAGELLNVDWGIVSAGYFATLHVPILRGRSFTAEEAARGAPVVVIDQALAERFWPGGDALGKHLKYDGPEPIEIVGIATTTRTYGDTRVGRVKIYTPFGRFPLRRSATFAVRVAAGAAPGAISGAAVAATIRGVLRAAAPDVPIYAATTLDAKLANALMPRTLSAWIVAAFAIAALLVGSLGIYGVMSYAVLQRGREIGIRIALGAQPGKIVRLVVSQGVALGVAGIALGLVLGFAAAHVLENQLFGVGPTSSSIYAGAAAVAVVVTLAACWLPARRAAAIDPLNALRYEQ